MVTSAEEELLREEEEILIGPKGVEIEIDTVYLEIGDPEVKVPKGFRIIPEGDGTRAVIRRIRHPVARVTN